MRLTHIKTNLYAIFFLHLYICLGKFQHGSNCCTFEDLESFVSQIIEACVSSLFDWSRAWGFTTTISSLRHFLESLRIFFFFFLSNKFY